MSSRAWVALWMFWLGTGFLLIGMWTRPIGLFVFGWMGLSTQAVAAAYAANEPRVFGKKRDGSVPIVSWVMFGPYLLMARLIVLLLSRVSRENDWDEIVPGLFLGRRAARVPDGTQALVDLTAELGRIPADAEYLPIPTLDGAAPRIASVVELTRYIERHERVAIHCAAGHGRSAMVMAAVLIARGHASSPDEAETLMRKKRPGIRMSGDQQKALVTIATKLSKS